jgi:hypothetical protein
MGARVDPPPLVGEQADATRCRYRAAPYTSPAEGVGASRGQGPRFSLPNIAVYLIHLVAKWRKSL